MTGKLFFTKMYSTMKMFFKTCFCFLTKVVRKIFVKEKTEIFSGGTHFHFYDTDVHNVSHKKDKNDIESEALDDTQSNQEINEECHK